MALLSSIQVVSSIWLHKSRAIPIDISWANIVRGVWKIIFIGQFRLNIFFIKTSLIKKNILCNYEKYILTTKQIVKLFLHLLYYVLQKNGYAFRKQSINNYLWDKFVWETLWKNMRPITITFLANPFGYSCFPPIPIKVWNLRLSWINL